MIKVVEVKTERLLLRQWHDDDLTPFALLNSDPVVMEYLPTVLSREESDDLAEKIIT